MDKLKKVLLFFLFFYLIVFISKNNNAQSLPVIQPVVVPNVITQVDTSGVAVGQKKASEIGSIVQDNMVKSGLINLQDLLSTNLTQKTSEKYKLDNLTPDLRDLHLVDIVSAILNNDIEKQRVLLDNIVSSFELNKVLNYIFNNDKTAIMNYIVSLDSEKILKTYYNLLNLNNIDVSLKDMLLNLSLKYGSLEILTSLIEKCKFVPDDKLIVKYFENIAQVKDIDKIQKFITVIKSVGLLQTFLEQRDKLAEHLGNPDYVLKAFIHYVAIYCNLSWLKILLKEGVLVQLWDFNKNTPIHVIIETEKYEKIEDKCEFVTLILKEKDITALYRNRQDKYATDLAMEKLNEYKKLLDLEKSKSKTSLIKQNEIQKQVDCYTKLINMLSQIYKD
ncbi:hypothetical protein KJ644_02780 [Candidatus Dependentiae bacterium]|nr:hypothetical protein [Candidatus Dependentiae bacterium]MBU4387374.1 hypothetical protein [Candidatus Dependentiae bacterium]MCG2756576.1 hypothetical protein [Candidatus Dependentiae bacterium]